MRVQLLALAAVLALAGLAAAAGGGDLEYTSNGRRVLLQTQASQINVTDFSSGSNFIKLTILQRAPATAGGMRFATYRYNGGWPDYSQYTDVPVGSVSSTRQDNVPSTGLITYQVTLSNIATGYYRIAVFVIKSASEEVQSLWPASNATPELGIAVGAPGAISITSVVNAPSDPTGSKFTVTFSKSNPDTASRFLYKVYKYGTDHTNSSNVVLSGGPIAMTPWINPATSFTTDTVSPKGLYSVWVQAIHSDPTLNSSNTTGANTPYAIGTPNKPEIVRVDEPLNNTASQFTVYFNRPAVDNLMRIGFSLTNVNAAGPVPVTCNAPDTCPAFANGYIADNRITALSDADRTQLGIQAQYKLVTGTVQTAQLFTITLWGINDVTPVGVASDPSAEVATVGEPGVPSTVQAADGATNLVVQFTKQPPLIASRYYYDVFNGTTKVLDNLRATVSPVANQTNRLQFTTGTLPTQWRYRVVVRATTGQGAVYNTASQASSNLAGVGQPGLPRNVEIQAGVSTLSVIWDAPAVSDTASSYTVMIYSDAGDSTFTPAKLAGTWSGIPWNSNSEDPQQTYYYSMPTPTGLTNGYYRAAVEAVNTATDRSSANSGIDRAALGDPGQITIDSVKYESYANLIRITFSEAPPLTGERYGLNVWSQPYLTEAPQQLGDWTNLQWGANDNGAGKKEMLINTVAGDGYSSWLQPGRYNFSVLAGNEARPEWEFGTASAISNQLIVGPPGRPAASAPDTTNSQLSITVAPGDPELATSYSVRTYGYDYRYRTCLTTNTLETLTQFPARTATSSAKSDGYEMGTYCIEATASLNYRNYGDYDNPIQSKKQDPLDIVHVGLPQTPFTPSLNSGLMRLGVSFQCPTIWNSDSMTFTLRRVDLGLDRVIYSASLDADNRSPRLARDGGEGDWIIDESWYGDNQGECSFDIYTDSIPDTDNDVGQYVISLVAHNGNGPSDASSESYAGVLGRPGMPTSVAVYNSATDSAAITIEVDVPPADVHGGYAMGLKWYHAGQETDVVYNASQPYVYTARDNVYGNYDNENKWLIDFPLSNMRCNGEECGGGQYEITYFAAVSRFNTDDQYISNPQYDRQVGNWITGSRLPTEAFPTSKIYIGNPPTPTGLQIMSRRIYNPAANPVVLRIDVPERDVAATYRVQLRYFPIQGDVSASRLVTKTFNQEDLEIVNDGNNKFVLPISLPELDCDPNTDGQQPCGAGSYEVAGITAISRVTGDAKQDADMEAGDLAAVAEDGGAIIVENEGGTLQQAQNVFVANTRLADTPADTSFDIELDIPATDNIMGWMYGLSYIPGSTGERTDVHDGSGDYAIYVPRLGAYKYGNRLHITVRLDDLRCDPGTGTYGTCNGGGKFELTTLMALSWFNENGEPVAENASGRDDAVKQFGFPGKQGEYGSPRSGPQPWFGTFYIGSPSVPTGILVPDVPLVDSPLVVLVDAPVADNAYSYTVALEKLPAGTDDGSGTRIDVEVFQANDARMLVTGNPSKFRLSIPAGQLLGAGRYRVFEVKAVSWFDSEGSPDRSPADFEPIHVIVGSPSDPPATAQILSAGGSREGTTFNVAIEAPDADVALYYTVSIEYHSGKRDPELLTVSNTDPATNTFTVMRWGESGRVARFDSSYGVNKLLLPVDLSQAQCNGQACGRGKYLVTAVTAHPWHASDAYPADGQPGAPENGWPAAGPGTIATEPMVGFTFMGDPETPTGVVGVSTLEAGVTTLTITFDRPEADNADFYYVEAKKYFPGGTESGTCTGRVYMPDGTDGITPYTDSGNTRTIGITGCQLTPGKFRVTTFRADSRFSQDGYQEADLDTTSVDSYFYMGPVGSVEYVDLDDIAEDTFTAGPINSLPVQWWQTQPDAAKFASVELLRYLTGDSDGDNQLVCSGNVDEQAWQDVAYMSGNSQPLVLNVPTCPGSAHDLQRGRYKLIWSVYNSAENAQSKMSDFFYIGNPGTPGKPTVRNYAEDGKLRVTFAVPENDNADYYSYTLYSIANPAVDQLGGNSVSTLIREDVRIAEATFGHSSVTFDINSVSDGLYKVLIKAHNPLKSAGEASEWSDAIGAGFPANHAISSVVAEDGVDRLPVTFSLIPNALKYQYTLYKEASSDVSDILSGHADIDVEGVSWSSGSSGSFDIVARNDAPLPAGRYTVHIRPLNTDLDGTTWLNGNYKADQTRAAVGVPTQPRDVQLSTVLDGDQPQTGKLLVTFTNPSTDSGMEYYYALFKADDTIDQQCFTTAGVLVAPTAANAEGLKLEFVAVDEMVSPTPETKSFVLSNVPSGDYRVVVGVRNAVVLGYDSDQGVEAQRVGGIAGQGAVCSEGELNKGVRWSDRSSQIVAVENPGQPGKPRVTYNHGAHTLTVVFEAPALSRKYQYTVYGDTRGTDSPLSGHVDIPADHAQGDIDFTIDTDGWEPGFYKVTVYVENDFNPNTPDASVASDGTYVGTPYGVSDVQLENTGSADTIKVLFAPPSVDIVFLSGNQGSYRYTVLSRPGTDWEPVRENENAGTLGGDAGQRSFEISGLEPGRYKVVVWGSITHPNGENDPADVTSTQETSSGDGGYMRNGIIGVGTPGKPLVTFAAYGGYMKITITGFDGPDNALSYKWVYLKDEDTNLDEAVYPAKEIPITTGGDDNDAIDPLTAQGNYPVAFRVPIYAELCGSQRNSPCDEGTYRVGVVGVNGFAEGANMLTSVAGNSIMGLPTVPQVTSMVVKADTLETLVTEWDMPNKWTALSYHYRIENAAGDDSYEDGLSWPDNQSFERTVSPELDGTYTGSGVYRVRVYATNNNDEVQSDAFPSFGRVVGIPIAGAPYGLRDVTVTDPENEQRQLEVTFKDGWNSWTAVGDECDTTYEWEVVTSPGLTRVAAASSAINPANWEGCGGNSEDTRGCSFTTDVSGGLPDGYYQVIVVAYNQYGFKRSEASNIVTVGAPSGNSQPLAVWAGDGDGKLSISFPTPVRPSSYQCKGTGANGAEWTAPTKTLAQVSISDDGKTTSFDITSTDVPALATTKQRWEVQCKPINPWSASVDWSVPTHAASGAPVAVAAPTMANSGNGVTFTFTPASPDAAIRYVFVLAGQNGSVWDSSPVLFNSSDLADGSAGSKVFTWTPTPSGQFTGRVRSINSVGNTTSDASSAPVVVGRPGKVGKPVVQNGQTSFAVSFNPGSPSTATAFYYNVYQEGGGTPVNTEPLLVDPAATTPSGGANYAGLTPADLLAFKTANLANLGVQPGVYQITVFAYNSAAPEEQRWSLESDKSEIASLGKPGIPAAIAAANGLRKLKVEFTVPSPDAAVYYEYSVRDASNLAAVASATRIQVPRSAVTVANGKVSFETVELMPYKQYQVRVTAVGYGSVFSQWTSSAVAGIPTAPATATLTPGATSLRVTFTGPALITSTDTFAYKLYTLGATPQAVGDANGYVVPRASITGDLASSSGQKYFDIALDSTYAALKAPADGYYVAVMPARLLADGSKELGPASGLQAQPATLGAPQDPPTKPTFRYIGTVRIIQWSYFEYSTYTRMEYRVKKASDGSIVTTGSIASSEISKTPTPTSRESGLLLTGLSGRFTVEVRLASDYGTSAYSPPSDVIAAGNPSGPTSVTITRGLTSLAGAFTLPTDPSYMTISYRLASIGDAAPVAGRRRLAVPAGNAGTPIMGWKQLTPAEIAAGTFTIPDPVSVGASSVPVPTNRYQLDMQVDAVNGAAVAEYIGGTSAQTPAYKGAPAPVTAGLSASSGVASIPIAFTGVEFATGYKLHVFDNAGAPVQSSDTALVVVLPVTGGVGTKEHTLTAAELGSPTGTATFKFKVEAVNPNTVDMPGSTNTLSPVTALVLFGKLAAPAKPEMEWFNPNDSDTGHAKLRFQAISAPAGSNPAYEYQLYNFTTGQAVGGWQGINMDAVSGDGSAGNPYVARLLPSPGRYTVTVRAKSILNSLATSDESPASEPEVMGYTGQPAIAFIQAGEPTIVTQDNGATTVKLAVTLPTNNSGTNQPQLQLRMDVVEPSAGNIDWANVEASCDSAALCIEGGSGTTADPLQVLVKLTAEQLPSPCRVFFTMRTVNDNGPGAESAASNTISVGRPKAPAVQAAGTVTGVKITFTPDTPETGDSWVYWAEDASAGSSSEVRLEEATVSPDVQPRQDGSREFTVPLDAFAGDNIPWIVTIKMAAVNSNGVRGPVTSAGPVTVGPVTAPRSTGAMAFDNDGTNRVSVLYTPGDTTGIADRYRIKAYPENSRMAVLTFNADTATSTHDEQGTILIVGGAAGQLPPGRWRFAVVAENSNSQAESVAYPVDDWISAGTPGAPTITGVTGFDGSIKAADITFTVASDNVAHSVRVFYSDSVTGWTAVPSLFTVPDAGAQKTITIDYGGDSGVPRSGNWQFKLEAVNTVGGAPAFTPSPASNAWPATTVGRPGAPEILSVTGSKDAIKVALRQAEDRSGISFILQTFDASGTAVSPAYDAPLVSVGAPDVERRQLVVYATDASRRGGTYRFKVVAVNSQGEGEASEMTGGTPVAAYMPATPTDLTAAGLADKATLTFMPTAGAVWYEAAIHAATGDWRVATDALALFAPCSLSAAPDGCTAVRQVSVEGNDKLAFDVPLSAFSYRDGQYAFKVRAVDANSVPGDWSDASAAVTVGVPDAPAALEVSSWANDSGVDLQFSPAWLAEQGYRIQVLSQDGQTVLDTVVVGADQTGSCAAKASAPQ